MFDFLLQIAKYILKYFGNEQHWHPLTAVLRQNHRDISKISFMFHKKEIFGDELPLKSHSVWARYNWISSSQLQPFNQKFT